MDVGLARELVGIDGFQSYNKIWSSPILGSVHKWILQQFHLK